MDIKGKKIESVKKQVVSFKKLKTSEPLKNKFKNLPLPTRLKLKPTMPKKGETEKDPEWMRPGYKPGSIKRGYTKYA